MGVHNVNYDGVKPLTGYDFGNRFALDYGDAPAPYPTLGSEGGASAGFLQGLSLGSRIDIDGDGQPNATATGDDVNGIADSTGAIPDDEDGIQFLRPIVAGDTRNQVRTIVQNSTGQNAYLHAWIDFNGDGDWSDSGEQIISNRQMAAGQTDVEFVAPSGAKLGTTFARFRLSQELNTLPTGRSVSGEVEDYAITITNTLDFAVDDNFTVARNSINNPLDVLANDFRLPAEVLTLLSVSGGSQGGTVRINSAKNGILYTPRNGFVGIETFTYSMRNGQQIVDSATVSVSVALTFQDPVAVDDSYDVATNTVGFPLNVLANDIEGKGGALQIVSVSTPDQGGVVVIGSGNQSLRYTPRRTFGGTETFTYTATDGDGKLTTASVTVHTLPLDRQDDVAGFTFNFLDDRGVPLAQPRIQQGRKFQVQVFVDDLRAPENSIVSPGVFAAYLDLLYNAALVTPSSSTPTPNNPFSFAVQFNSAIYGASQQGTAEVPGKINDLGAFSSNPDMDNPDPVLLATITFEALAPGLVDFIGDPADDSPQTDVLMFNTPSSPIPIQQVRFGRATLEIVGNSIEFPTAVDDSFEDPFDLNSVDNALNVLANDSPGSTNSIRLSNVTQPVFGSTFIDDQGTSDLKDDVVRYTPNFGFVGTDQFTYTIQDARGFISIGQVTVQVGDSTLDNDLQMRLEIRDQDGKLISDQNTEGTVNVDQVFYVLGYVKDLRGAIDNAGVFAAFQDILYDADVAAPVTSSSNTLGFDVDFALTNARYNFLDASLRGKYNRVFSGDVVNPNVINEIGSVQIGDQPLGDQEYLQFAMAFKAKAPGRLALINDPADISPFHDSLLFDPADVVTIDLISYLSTAVTVVQGEGEGFTNINNRFDVNNDGFASPMDMLIVINSLNSTGSRDLRSNGGGEGESPNKRYFFDVNMDGFISPIDALMIVNHLNARGTNAGGEGEGTTGEGEGSVALILEENKNTAEDTPVFVQSTRMQNQLATDLSFGPMQTTDRPSNSAMNLGDYLAMQKAEETEVDSLIDDLAIDTLRNG